MEGAPGTPHGAASGVKQFLRSRGKARHALGLSSPLQANTTSTCVSSLAASLLAAVGVRVMAGSVNRAST
jgi:putative effector of murein hydrolase